MPWYHVLSAVLFGGGIVFDCIVLGKVRRDIRKLVKAI